VLPIHTLAPKHATLKTVEVDDQRRMLSSSSP